MDVLAPMQSASVSTAALVKSGAFRRTRTAYRRSRTIPPLDGRSTFEVDGNEAALKGPPYEWVDGCRPGLSGPATGGPERAALRTAGERAQAESLNLAGCRLR